MTDQEIQQLKYLTALPEWAAVQAWFRVRERELVQAVKNDPSNLVNAQRLRLLDEIAQELSADG